MLALADKRDKIGRQHDLVVNRGEDECLFGGGRVSSPVGIAAVRAAKAIDDSNLHNTGLWPEPSSRSGLAD